VKLTTHLHLMSRLRKRGAILLFPHYVFIAWGLIKQWIRLHDIVLS
jgi:hypothetical protein